MCGWTLGKWKLLEGYYAGGRGAVAGGEVGGEKQLVMSTGVNMKMLFT